MNAETQANRLATLMAKKGHLPSYELALPLVTVRHSQLKKLAVGDVFLLGFAHLECLMIKDNMIRATVQLERNQNRYCFRIIKLQEEMMLTRERKKYESVRFVLCSIQSRTLALDHTVDILASQLETIKILVNDKKVAEASLVNVEGELAVQIDKVEKDG